MLNAITYSHLIRALMDGEHTRGGLARITGLHGETVSRYVGQLHRRRVVRIADWVRNPVNGNWCPVYTLNHEGLSDMTKPKPKGRAQVEREYRGRRKAIVMNQIFGGNT